MWVWAWVSFGAGVGVGVASGKLVDVYLERAQSSSERVGDSLLVDVETFLFAGRDAKSQSGTDPLTPNP